ncbi:MAG: ABC transporter permease [bacterium]|jgi:putative spermidine/putrescine transport system permease protein|nr:ABC transporter permease [Betaproteobacteria bacterium]
MRLADRLARPVFVAIVALVLAFVTLPSLVVVVVAFGDKSIMMFPPDAWSLRWFERALTYPDFRKGMVNGLYISAWASLLAVAVGTMGAYAIDRFRFRGSALLESLLLSPLVIPHFTLGVGLLILASGLGLSRGYAVVVLCHLILVVPFVMRSVYVSLKNIDPMLERAAASLGARPLTVFLRIHLPLLAPGLAGGWLFAFILSFNEFTATLFVTNNTTQTLPVAMYNYVREYADPTMAALSALLIGITALFLVVANRFLGLDRILSIGSHR